MMTKVHAIRTGSVRIKESQMAGRGRGIARLGHVLIDRDWSDAGGLAHVVGCRTWLHPIEWNRAKGIGGQVQGYLPHRWPQWSNPEPLRFEAVAFGPFRERMLLTKRGDVFVVPTPGHTPGHVSIIVRGAPSIFIAGDTSYTQELLEQGVVDGVSRTKASRVKPTSASSCLRASSRWFTCRRTIRRVPIGSRGWPRWRRGCLSRMANLRSSGG